MNKRLPVTIEESLKIPFQKILAYGNYGDAVNEITELICTGSLEKKLMDEILSRYKIKDIGAIKSDILQLLLDYVNQILDDNYVTTNEAENVKFLKMFFNLKEGDFYNKKYDEVERVLVRQLEAMFDDNSVNNVEALQQVELQTMFDLSYDQFQELTRSAVQNAIDRGANPLHLDTFIKN